MANGNTVKKVISYETSAGLMDSIYEIIHITLGENADDEICMNYARKVFCDVTDEIEKTFNVEFRIPSHPEVEDEPIPAHEEEKHECKCHCKKKDSDVSKELLELLAELDKQFKML